MTQALGGLQEAGAFPQGGPAPGTVMSAGAGFASDGRRLSPQELLAAAGLPSAQLRGSLGTALPGAVPSLDARPRERLHETMYRDMQGYFDDPDMRRGLRCVLSEAERRVNRGGFDGGSGPFGAVPTNKRGQVIVAAKDFMMDYRAGYGGGGAGGDNGFSERCGVRLSAAQLADLDHFFFGAHTGTIPVVGTAMCAGGVGFWDGLKPIFCNWREPACQDSIAYNWKQLGAGFKGCAAGTSITKASLGLRRGS